MSMSETQKANALMMKLNPDMGTSMVKFSYRTDSNEPMRLKKVPSAVTVKISSQRDHHLLRRLMASQFIGNDTRHVRSLQKRALCHVLSDEPPSPARFAMPRAIWAACSREKRFNMARRSVVLS